jgi:hypothetical protein
MSSIDTESVTDNKLDDVYNQGFKDGYNELRNREYHAGYKHGYRDACEDRYWNGWYGGLMIGSLVSIIGGFILCTTTKKNRISPF